jgi:hypothetical protein
MGGLICREARLPCSHLALLKLVRLCYSSALARERDGVPR